MVRVMKLNSILLFLLVASTVQAQSAAVGSSIYGDFNGDGIKEYAFSVQTKSGVGNAIENGTPGSYAVYFSINSIPTIEAGCCEIILINEGDLKGDGADDISLYQAPMNGNTYSLTTLSLKDTVWETIVPLFLIQTGVTPLSPSDLEQRVYSKCGIIYYLDNDVNDENLTLIEQEVRLQ